MSMDRDRKTDFFRTVPSLQTFLIVYQDAVRVEVWRHASGWEMQTLGPGEAIDLPELDGALHVTDSYQRVTF